MDADERLTDLKKAYADIILNTAKEAAARIMVSERKALRFQQELFVAKGEAVQMLLRLKKLMDSKAREAETTSLSQQKKIEELEAQLQEAEDIVKDLRGELREVQAELERATNNREELREVQHNSAVLAEMLVENRVCASQPIVFPTLQSRPESTADPENKSSNLSGRNEGGKCCNAAMHMASTYFRNPDIPSIILRSKEPEQYRNGCTHRIRACERNLLNGELSFSAQTNNLNDENSVKEDEQSGNICAKLSGDGDKILSIEKKEVVQPNNKLSSLYQVQVVDSFRRKRKRAARCKKNSTLLRRYNFDQCMRLDQVESTITKNESNLAKDESDEDSIRIAPTVPLGSIEIGIQPRQANSPESGSLKACEAVNMENMNGVSTDNDVVMPPESELEESSDVAIDRKTLEKVDLPSSVNYQLKASDTSGGVCYPVNERIIKYTFQRKRKREPLNGPGKNASIEKGTMKKALGDQQDNTLGQPKSSLVTESSRGSRRLAQVARQLMSLSERKWWQ